MPRACGVEPCAHLVWLTLRYSLCHQRIVFLIALVSFLPEAGVHVLAAMLRVLSRFGKIGVTPFDAGIFGAVRKLSVERRLTVLIAILAFDGAFLHIIVLIWHVCLLGRGDGVLPRAGRSEEHTSELQSRLD